MLRHLIQKEKLKPMGAREALALSYRPGLRTLDYDKLHTGVSLKKLLPAATSGVLILFGDKRRGASGVGHWVLLFRSPECGVEFFGSYGLGYRGIIRVSHNPNKLQKILSKTHAYINKHPYQSKEHSQTCARHAVTRYNCAHLKPREYAALMHDPRMSADEIVTMLTLSQDLTKFRAK